jgi:hypothetical protein
MRPFIILVNGRVDDNTDTNLSTLPERDFIENSYGCFSYLPDGALRRGSSKIGINAATRFQSGDASYDHIPMAPNFASCCCDQTVG